MKRFFFFFFILIFSSTSLAYEVRSVCASYQSGFKWTRSESAEIAIYSGSEIQNKVGYNQSIMPYEHYAFVNWDNGYISVVKLNIYFSGMMLFNTEGVESNGRKWRFSDNTTGFCI